MQKPALSSARIASIVLVVVTMVAMVVLAQPVKYQLRQWAEPAVVRPEIAGIVYFHGVPASGVELRVAKVGSSNWPSCNALPVVAVSNKAGLFHAPALRKPSFLVNKSQRIPVGVCLTRGKIQIDSWVSFLLPNERPVVQLKCEFPGPQPNLQFFGFARSPAGVLPWFIARPPTSWSEAWWVTYIPTCWGFPSTVQLMVHSSRTPSVAQLGAISFVATSNMSPNISIQRTRCARR